MIYMPPEMDKYLAPPNGEGRAATKNNRRTYLAKAWHSLKYKFNHLLHRQQGRDNNYSLDAWLAHIERNEPDLFMGPTVDEALETAAQKICGQYGIQQEDQRTVLTILTTAYYHAIETFGFKRPVVPVNGSQRHSDISDEVYGTANQN